MSIEMISIVSKMDFPSSGAKFTAIALANYADEEGSCFPSIKTLSKWTGQGDKTIRRHLEELEELSFLSRERIRRKDGSLGVYRYRLDPHGMQRNEPAAKMTDGEPPAKMTTTTGQNDRLTTGQNDRAEPSTPEPSTPPPHSLTSSARSSEEHRARARAPEEVLMQVLDSEHVKAVMEHRKAIRCPLTPHGAKLLAKELAEWSDANDAADIMISAGWRGFRADWARNRVDRDRWPLARRSGAGVNGQRRGLASVAMEMLTGMRDQQSTEKSDETRIDQ